MRFWQNVASITSSIWRGFTSTFRRCWSLVTGFNARVASMDRLSITQLSLQRHVLDSYESHTCSTSSTSRAGNLWKNCLEHGNLKVWNLLNCHRSLFMCLLLRTSGMSGRQPGFVPTHHDFDKLTVEKSLVRGWSFHTNYEIAIMYEYVTKLALNVAQPNQARWYSVY